MKKPIIGVVARPYITDNGRNVLCILENIRKSIIKNGGIPIVILPTKDMVYINNREDPLNVEDEEILDSQINLCDGILMPGGDKIYNYDRYICKVANDKNIPLLGICMGMQVMCNYNNENKNTKIEGHKEPNAEYVHTVSINKDSLLYNIIEKDEINVNSLHGYMVPNSGDYEISAKCNDIIEGIEKRNCLFNIGVQWHPEKNSDENDTRIFSSFINACKQYMNEKK